MSAMQEHDPLPGEVEEGGEHDREDPRTGRDGEWDGPRTDAAEGPDNPSLKKRLGNQKRRRGSSFPNRWNYDDQ
jgi:hypothetical protein